MARAREGSGTRPLRLPQGAAGRAMAVPLVAALLLAVACGGNTVKKKKLGDPCDPNHSGQCADALCLPLDDRSGVCSRGCQVDACPDDFTCEDSGSHGLVCLKKESCESDEACPSGHRCDQSSGKCYIKVARQLCAPCTTDLQCPEGGGCFTVPSSGERYCTTACGEGDACPKNYVCREVGFFANGATATRKQCVPDNAAGTCEGGRGLCAPCKGDDECGGFSDLCVRNVVSGEQFCGLVCDPARGVKACPKGFNCLDLSGVEQGPYQCVPNSSTCAGYCDSADERVQVLQCGLGRMCNLEEKLCQGATDGRECSPCATNDDCRKAGHESNECVVNDCQDCPTRGETFCAEPCPCSAAGCADGTAACQDRFGAGFVCAQVGSSAFCVPQRGTCLSGLGRLGDDCSGGPGDCVTGVCLAYGKINLCSSTCAKDADCADGRYRCCERAGDFYDCSDSKRNAAGDGPSSGAGVCAPNGGLFGDDCRPGRPPCQSGTCLDIGTARLCTVPCGAADSCPSGFECRYASADLSEILHCESQEDCPANYSCDFSINQCRVKVCFPDGGGTIQSDCTFGPAACTDKLCIKKDSGPVCTQPCDPAGEETCPSGWACTSVMPVGRTEKIDACWPDNVTVP